MTHDPADSLTLVIVLTAIVVVAVVVRYLLTQNQENDAR